ncbi:Uncharacterised protein [Mycobacteroides abscessus]|nr:Uncharacterised protein [Mycobacteroides abscessus]
MAGPTIDGITQAAANAAKTFGRRSVGKTRATSTYSATMYRPVPTPWSTRPATSTSMSCASPATSSPARKSPMPVHSGVVGPARSLQRPDATMPTTLDASDAANASVYSVSPSSSTATVGMAVATASASNAPRNTNATMPNSTVRCVPGESVPVSAGPVSGTPTSPVPASPAPGAGVPYAGASASVRGSAVIRERPFRWWRALRARGGRARPPRGGSGA